MLFERVKILSEKRGKNIKTVALELGLSENYFYSWKTSSPKTEVLQKVADYFDVSLDYLTGRTDNPSLISEDNSDHFAEFFKMETEGMTKDEIEILEKEWKQFLIIRKQMFKDDK